jgi:YD repeat-containing protein
MKNILGTEENLELFNENGIKVYSYYKDSYGFIYECTYDLNGKLLTSKDSDGYSCEYTYDSNGNVLTSKHSNGFSYEYTYDSKGKVLTYKDSNGVSRAFDKTYTIEEVEFIKRAVQEYWEHCFAEHPENQNDLKLTQQILNK